jgi:hypothetical protein
MQELIAKACNADADWTGADRMMVSSLDAWWAGYNSRGPIFTDADELIQYLREQEGQ